MKINKTRTTRFLQLGTSLVAVLALSIVPSYARVHPLKGQKTASHIFDNIDFGDDSSQWSNDGECDDPRFIGPATAVEMEEADISRDASDCLALYKAGDVTLKPAPADVIDNINFGDNSSEWADNGICDDPRFGGSGTDELLLDEDMNHDSADCRSLFLSGQVKYLGDDINSQTINFDGIDFGDNTSEWKSDGECDDPRFRGTGMAAQLVEADLGHDAIDCVTLYKEGSITLTGNATPANTGNIDFGDDTSQWANDNECDDPRFAGEGVSGILLDSDLGHDASDCRSLFNAGKIYLGAAGGDVSNSGIDFGDDNNQYANDGECDDPRFAGAGVATVLLDKDLGHDASDCRILYENGEIRLANANTSPATGLLDTDFGDNTGRWTDDGECDDPRFIGEGMAYQLIASDIGHDANDCQSLVNSGKIALITASNLDFGDDKSEWPNDGECDDPRFAGEGSAQKLDPKNLGHDATDCRTLLNSGAVDFVGGFPTMTTATTANNAQAASPITPPSQSANSIVWGDNTSNWANDGECDDPRFSGPGAADILQDVDKMHDATDCQTLYNAGQLQFTDDPLRPTPTPSVKGFNNSLKGFHSFGFDFGDNSSEYANNEICDDPRFSGPGADDVLLAEDQGHDANDCKALFRVGRVSLATDLSIDFGNDQSQWSNDGECDDPRFAGKTMAADLSDENIKQDASDCRGSFELGRIYLIEDGIVKFGDDSSEWAKDGECDDPRFAGSGAAPDPLAENLMRDATDCRANYRSGSIYLNSDEKNAAPINFGDNTSEWASDGECDDPRFFGPGSAEELVDEDLGHDAQDCSALLQNGQVQFGAAPAIFDKNKGNDANTPSNANIDFGDDSSQWSNDGECDDPRFFGPGSATTLIDEDLAHDATDCRSLLESGQVDYISDQSAPVETSAIMHDGIDFGDNSSEYANNQICDDLRFAGEGVDSVLLPEDENHDATDCLNNYMNGTVYLATQSQPSAPTPATATSDIDFGDDTSAWANDNQCDDPRFEGEAVAGVLLDEDMGHDATDCSALFAQGKIQLVDDSSTPPPAMATSDIDFGDDTSAWANDNQCDDPRFEGEGTAPPLLAEDEGHDATDCQTLFNQGMVQLAGSQTPPPPPPANGAIDFGDNTSTWVNDGMCDDPRFEGEGTSPPLLPEDEGHDAADCSALFDQGKIQLIGGAPDSSSDIPADPDNIVFGDNTSLFSGDNECDDPRFTGPGMAPAPQFEGDRGHDADDCQALFLDGEISLK